MIDITALKNNVIKLNTRAAQLNDERQRKLGAAEAARKRLETLKAEYKAKYGVEVTDVEAEYAKVVSETETSVAALQRQIAYIESGAYKNDLPAENTAADGAKPDNAPAASSVPAVYPPVIPAVPVSAIPAQASETPIAGIAPPTTTQIPVMPAPSVSVPSAALPTAPVIPPAGLFAGAPEMSASTGTTTDSAHFEAEEYETVGATFTPVGWGDTSAANQAPLPPVMPAVPGTVFPVVQPAGTVDLSNQALTQQINSDFGDLFSGLPMNLNC